MNFKILKHNDLKYVLKNKKKIKKNKKRDKKESKE